MVSKCWENSLIWESEVFLFEIILLSTFLVPVSDIHKHFFSLPLRKEDQEATHILLIRKRIRVTNRFNFGNRRRKK